MPQKKYSEEKIKQVLNHDCFQKCNYYDGTFAEFLAECLKTLWEEGEGFSGKRPICDSGWEWIAGEALSILEPKIGKMNKDEWGNEDFDVNDEALYQDTFNWLINYIFKV